MPPPTGTLYPSNLDNPTNIGAGVSAGDTIASAYANTQSSAILAMEGALGTNPMGSDASVGAALLARTRFTDIQNQAAIFSSDGGTANTYEIGLSPPLSSYLAGQVVCFGAANANTGASTLNVNSVGAAPLVKNGSEPLAAGDISADQIIMAVVDGAGNWQIISSMVKPSLRVGVNPQSANYTATATDAVIPVTTGASTITLTLPANSSSLGQFLFVQKADSGAGSVVVTAAGTDVINGASTTSLTTQYNSVTLAADGAGNWLILATT